MQTNLQQIKVHIFWEGDKILWNLHGRFVLFSASQIYGGDFAKFCGLLRIYELYQQNIEKTYFARLKYKKIPLLKNDNFMQNFRIKKLKILLPDWHG